MAYSQEESSWTFYIEGFMCENDLADDDHNCSFSSEYESPSLVSDAASSPVKKLKDAKEKEHIRRVSSGKNNINHMAMCKQINFKKQKNKAMHDLEDTASSPVNSPKMFYINPFMMNHKGKDEMEASQVKRNTINFGKGRDLTAGRDDDYAGLKKRCSG